MSSVKPPKYCAFCDKPGTMTKQHIWPKWLKKIRHPVATSHTQVTGEFLTFSPRSRHLPYQATVHQGHAGSRKIKNVCQMCNNGWMSRIAEAAKETAVPLILGQSLNLTTYHQRELARWFTLMTMMVEFTSPATAALTSDDRRYLKDRLDPPPIFKMWIGRYSGTRPEQHWCRHVGMNMSLTPEGSGDPYRCNTQVTTIVIGALCIHTYSSTVDPNFPGYAGAPLEQVWPVQEQSISWPPLIGLGDDRIVALAESLAAQTIPVSGWD
jgi:hypothetical protein